MLEEGEQYKGAWLETQPMSAPRTPLRPHRPALLLIDIDRR